MKVRGWVARANEITGIWVPCPRFLEGGAFDLSSTIFLAGNPISSNPRLLNALPSRSNDTQKVIDTPYTFVLFFPVFANQHPRLLTLRLKGFVSFQFASPVVPSASHCPQFPAHHPPKLFKINTCKSLSKQTTLTVVESYSYKKHRGWGCYG